MKYVHPKLGIEVNTNYVNGTPSVDYTKVYNHEVYIGVKCDMLKDMGFEQVEETPEWIEKAYKNYYKMPDEVGCANEKNLLEFANAILYYMPKQEKITVDEVNKVTWVDEYGIIQYIHHSMLIDLLRDKGLLQE